MSLEEQIKALTEAVQANTEAIKAAGGSAAAATSNSKAADAETTSASTGTGRGRGRPAKDKTVEEPSLTAEQVKAKAVQVKDKLGTPKAKELITKYAPELAKIKPADFEAFVADCDKALNGEDEDDDQGEDDL